MHRPTRRRRLPVHGRGRLRRAGPRRLRGHPGRLRRQPLDRRGHRRRVQGRTTAKIPNSFVFRYVPAHPGDLQHGKLEALQVLNAASNPITVESQTALDAPDQVALHTYGNVFDDQLGDDSQHRESTATRRSTRTRWRRRRTRHRSSVPRMALPPGLELWRVLLRRDRRHERDEGREHDVRRLGGHPQADAVRSRRQTPGRCRSSSRAPGR